MRFKTQRNYITAYLIVKEIFYHFQDMVGKAVLQASKKAL